VQKSDFTIVHYYDQDLVDIYDKCWLWLQDSWQKPNKEIGLPWSYFNYPGNKTVSLFETCFSTFFLVYNTKKYSVSPLLDIFYEKQEANGAIRGEYSVETGKPVFSPENPEGVQPPLFSWVEYNLYHKVGNKKRLKDIMPVLEKHYEWLENTFQDDSGLYSVPLHATMMPNAPREKMHYPIDFNTQQAINALYLSAIGDTLNDKDLSFKYKRKYFSLKTRINSLMWNENDQFFYDLDKDRKQIPVKTIAAFWPLLAEIPNEAKADGLIAYLRDPGEFGTHNPFPTVAASEPAYEKEGEGYRGSVFPPFTFMVIKGLEKYARYTFARECAIKHLYTILDTFKPDSGTHGAFWEAYKPETEGPAIWTGNEEFNRKTFLTFTSLSTITLMIENVIGLYISLPKKTVDWIVPTLERMGIEDLYLKRNKITILSNKTDRGWEIRLESEKLYYFTINIIGMKKKTLPIPSGKCSMLIDKL
jgi:neutral trehalase